MKIEIKEQKKNPLLKREEVSVSLEHPGKATPSRREILPELAKVLKSREELLIIDKIFSVHGKNVSEARVLAYKKKDEIPKEKLEKMKGRMMEKKKAAPAEAPAPAEAAKEGEKPSEEAPKEGETKEEKSEEAPKEEKPAEEAKPEEKKKEAPAEEKKGEPKQEEQKPEEKKDVVSRETRDISASKAKEEMQTPKEEEKA